MELMSTEVVAGLTVFHLTLIVIALFVIGIALQSLRKGRDDAERLMVQVSCAMCGWKGRMSRHQKKCPQCNADINA